MKMRRTTRDEKIVNPGVYEVPEFECPRCGHCCPEREWVGLTEQDVHDAFQFTELIKQLSFDRERPEWCENFAAYLEAKLKEKNV
jgi:Fe-S-cluster containining protein